MFGLMAAGLWKLERGTNIGDAGTPFCDVQACADGKFVTVAPTETRFFEELLLRLDIPAPDFPGRWDRTKWPRMREMLEGRLRTRDARCELLESTVARLACVPTMAEAPITTSGRARNVREGWRSAAVDARPRCPGPRR